MAGAVPEDENHMRRAIRLAENNPKYPFAAVLVDEERKIVGEGWNRSVHNPTWHGEMDAINKCAAAHPKIDWTSLTLYTTAEPCAMCQGAVAWAGISRVVLGE
jgi:tRNA(Arg) A34 adenosine deaminase TadA